MEQLTLVCKTIDARDIIGLWKIGGFEKGTHEAVFILI
jgi:hypothetical protein